MWYTTLPIITIPEQTGGTTPPVFHSGVDCPANVWSAIRSCPNLATWIIAVGVGGLLVGYYIGRR